MNSKVPDRPTDRRPVGTPTDGRGWRIATTRHPSSGRRQAHDRASRGAWLLLGDGRPALGISRPG